MIYRVVSKRETIVNRTIKMENAEVQEFEYEEMDMSVFEENDGGCDNLLSKALDTAMKSKPTIEQKKPEPMPSETLAVARVEQTEVVPVKMVEEKKSTNGPATREFGLLPGLLFVLRIGNDQTLYKVFRYLYFNPVSLCRSVVELYDGHVDLGIPTKARPIFNFIVRHVSGDTENAEKFASDVVNRAIQNFMLFVSLICTTVVFSVYGRILYWIMYAIYAFVNSGFGIGWLLTRCEYMQC
jgi:hypothetical protein